MTSLMWKRTELSVDPPSWDVADRDVTPFIFDPEEPIVDATCDFIRLDTKEEVPGSVTTPSIGVDNYVTVTVSNLIRGVAYELSVNFGNNELVRWTRTLVIRCVA
jgi:hypothetical protein